MTRRDYCSSCKDMVGDMDPMCSQCGDSWHPDCLPDSIRTVICDCSDHADDTDCCCSDHADDTDCCWADIEYICQNCVAKDKSAKEYADLVDSHTAALQEIETLKLYIKTLINPADAENE